MEVAADETWESPNTGAKADFKGSWTGAGKLAGSKKFPGHVGSCEPGIVKKDWRKAKSTDHIKELVMEVVSNGKTG